jgi:hypothetical protein
MRSSGGSGGESMSIAALPCFESATVLFRLARNRQP